MVFICLYIYLYLNLFGSSWKKAETYTFFIVIVKRILWHLEDKFFTEPSNLFRGIEGRADPSARRLLRGYIGNPLGVPGSLRPAYYVRLRNYFLANPL